MDPRWEVPRASMPGHRRYVLVILQGSGTESSMVSVDLFRRLRRMLREKISTTRNLTEIDVWLDSPGGDANAAYKIALLLRSYAAVIRVVVPDHAKGAATLLALSADEIYLAPAAELGPLDTQMDREPGGIRLSALDTVKSADHVSRTALRFALSGATAILEQSDLSRPEALDVAVQLSAQLYQPLAQRIHPARVLEAQNLLDVAVKYADVLASMRNPEVLDPECGPLDIEALVKEYPNRSFVIDLDEARELGLPVQPLWKYAAADAVQELHEHVEEQGCTKVDIRDSEIDIRTAPGAAEPATRGFVVPEPPAGPVVPPAATATPAVGAPTGPLVRPPVREASAKDVRTVGQPLDWNRDLDPSEDPANW